MTTNCTTTGLIEYSTILRRNLAWLTSLILMTGASPHAFAAPPARAEDVLDRFVEVTGGKAAYAELKSRITKLTITPVGSGLSLQMTSFATRPNKTFSQLESDSFGQILNGTDGEVVWEKSLMTGPVVKEGQERALVMRASTFDRHVRWRELYSKVDCVGIEEIDGKPAFRVELTPNEGEVETAFFDKETGLQVKAMFQLKLPMGTIPIEILLSDYRDIDGVMYPHKARKLSMGREVLIVTTSIEHNVEIPADRFEVPAEIKALVQQRASSELSGKGS